MNYDEFRAAFLQALRESGLSTIGGVPSEEALDLRSTNRTLTVYVEPVGRGIDRPFHVSGVVSWRWDALQTARTATTEEDLLTELLGREDAHGVETERPWLRVDIELRAGLEVGKLIPLPGPASWAKWNREAMGRLQGTARLVTEDMIRDTADWKDPAVLAWQGDPEITVTCNRLGELRLESLTISAFQGIDLPRKWDDSEHEPDGDPGEQLRAMFQRVKAALDTWTEVVDLLA